MRIGPLRILGKKYRVQWFPDELKKDASCAGEIFFTQGVIFLKPRAAADYTRGTIMHEICHALDHYLGLDLKEEQIDRLANGLDAVLADNPRFAATYQPEVITQRKSEEEENDRID